MQLTVDQNLPSEEYLCDYVYIDNLRLSHYYAQLSKNGLVTGLKKTAKEIGKQGSQLNLKAPIIGGQIAGERTTEEWQELQIDSAFSRPQETLDALYSADFIGQGFADARMGALILAKGAISLFDIRMMKEIWPFMGNFVAESKSAHIQNIKERQRVAAAEKKEFDHLASIISRMPHSLQGNLSAEQQAAWFTLKPDCMLVNPEDLTFKHGSDLKGEWHVLGIVDALPDSIEEADEVPFTMPTNIEFAMRTMLGGLREMFGRPKDRFGLTPLMIFRVIRKT